MLQKLHHTKYSLGTTRNYRRDTTSQIAQYKYFKNSRKQLQKLHHALQIFTKKHTIITLEKTIIRTQIVYEVYKQQKRRRKCVTRYKSSRNRKHNVAETASYKSSLQKKTSRRNRVYKTEYKLWQSFKKCGQQRTYSSSSSEMASSWVTGVGG